MTKNKLSIGNPLTLIAIFSMLTEASAAVSLPYIDSENQKIYVWFLIVFPSFLITLFFLTLNFNNKSLYTPADFSKEKNPLKAQAATHQTLTEAPLSLTTPQTPELPLQAGSKFSLYTPQNVIVLPQANSGCKPEENTPTPLAEPYLLVDGGIPKSLYMIDLSYRASPLVHDKTLEEALRSHYGMTRNSALDSRQHEVLLILTNNQSGSASSLESLRANIHHNAPDSVQTSVITYNTDTHTLNAMG